MGHIGKTDREKRFPLEVGYQGWLSPSGSKGLMPPATHSCVKWETMGTWINIENKKLEAAKAADVNEKNIQGRTVNRENLCGHQVLNAGLALDFAETITSVSSERTASSGCQRSWSREV